MMFSFQKAAMLLKEEGQTRSRGEVMKFKTNCRVCDERLCRSEAGDTGAADFFPQNPIPF